MIYNGAPIKLKKLIDPKPKCLLTPVIILTRGSFFEEEDRKLIEYFIMILLFLY